MRSFRSKPVGWRGESYRHSLAARGYHSKKPVSVEKHVVIDIKPLTTKEKIRNVVDEQKFIPGTKITRAAMFQRVGRPGVAAEATHIMDKYGVKFPESQREALFVAEELGGEKAARAQLRPVIYQLEQREKEPLVVDEGADIVRMLPRQGREFKKERKNDAFAGEKFFKYQQALKELNAL